MIIPTYLIIILIFVVLIILVLITLIVYMMFFKKVPVIVFGANGIPNEIKKAKKRKNRLYFEKGINFEILSNYIAVGKKRIYFVQKLDERTFVPFSFVNNTEALKSIEIAYNISKEEKEFKDKLKLNFSKKYIKILDEIENLKEKIDFSNNKIEEEKQQISFGNEKYFFIDRKKIIQNFKNNIILLNKKLDRLKIKESKFRTLEEKKITNLGKEKKTKISYLILGKQDVNYNILTGIADSYEEGAIRFKFGLEKFAPFITIAVVAMVCVIGTVMAMKYATQITPVEADLMKEIGSDMRICAGYVSEGQKTNLAILEQFGSINSGDPPK